MTCLFAELMEGMVAGVNHAYLQLQICDKLCWIWSRWNKKKVDLPKSPSPWAS